MLAKPTGAICNLDCRYCFFLSKEMLYPGSRFRMADEMLETYIRQLLEGHQILEVNVAWQGGYPKDRSSSSRGELGLNYLWAGYKLFFHHVDQPTRSSSSAMAVALAGQLMKKRGAGNV